MSLWTTASAGVRIYRLLSVSAITSMGTRSKPFSANGCADYRIPSVPETAGRVIATIYPFCRESSLSLRSGTGPRAGAVSLRRSFARTSIWADLNNWTLGLIDSAWFGSDYEGKDGREEAKRIGFESLDL